MSRRALYLSSSVLLALLLIASLAWWSWRPPEASSIVASKSPLVRTLQFSARVATLSRVDVGSTLQHFQIVKAYETALRVAHQGHLVTTCGCFHKLYKIGNSLCRFIHRAYPFEPVAGLGCAIID